MIKFNDQEIKFTKFSNNETKLNLNVFDLNFDSTNYFTFGYEDDSSLIELFIFKSHLDSMNIKNLHLLIKYMPYSRLDRKDGNIAFTLKYISNLINSMDFDSIMITEPHSDVCLGTLNKAKAHYITPILVDRIAKTDLFDKETDFLFFPDSGAQKRYSKMFPDFKYLVGFKSRDFESSDIETLEVLGSIKPNSKIIIVDDLCSGGRTFKMSADKLKELGCGDIYLVVAHCENTIFQYGFLDDENIKQVFTTDTIIKTQTHDKLTIVEL